MVLIELLPPQYIISNGCGSQLASLLAIGFRSCPLKSWLRGEEAAVAVAMWHIGCIVKQLARELPYLTATCCVGMSHDGERWAGLIAFSS